MDSDTPTLARDLPPDFDEEAGDWVSATDWRSYEAYVTGALQRRFPGAPIRANVRRRGLKSGVMRQIDVLADVAEPVAFDCKCYGRKVDVKHVEAFLGMLDDLGVHAGVLVTTKGYSAAALERARNDDRNIDLQILSPDRLSTFQHVGDPIIWSGNHGVSLSPPEGWVVDDQPGEALVTMYPLGHTRESASAHSAFIYANILTKPSPGATLDDVAEPHVQLTLHRAPGVRFEIQALTIHDRSGPKPALLRRARYDPEPCSVEHCLYVDHGGAVLLLGLWSPPGEAEGLEAKLLALASDAFILDVDDRRGAGA